MTQVESTPYSGTSLAGATSGSDDRRFAWKLLVIIGAIVFVGFSLELAIDFHLAVERARAQGKSLSLSDLVLNAPMARAITSPMARAYNNTLALILTFIGLAIPITANMYTPKLIEIFVRDRINLGVLGFYAVLTAHSLIASSLAFDAYVATIPVIVSFLGAVLGWTIILPYYFYVLSFLNPSTIIERVQQVLLDEYRDAQRRRYPVAVSQRRLNQKINHLGNVLLRAVDRADRDVAIDAIKAHMQVLKRFHDVKKDLDPAFFDVSDAILVGMSSAACRHIAESRIWVEQRILTQLLLAYNAALGKMPDGVSTLADAVKDAAHYEATHGEPQVLDLLVRVLNTFVREAVKKKDVFSIYNCFYNYKSLTRKLLAAQRGDKIPELARNLRYYADFSKAQGMPFIYELASYELGELCEFAATAGDAAATTALLDAVLSLEGVGASVRLVKSRLILAGYLHEKGRREELARVLDSLAPAPAALLAQARREFSMEQVQIFWEITDRGTNFDYVEEGRRARIIEVLDALTARPGEMEKAKT